MNIFVFLMLVGLLSSLLLTTTVTNNNNQVLGQDEEEGEEDEDKEQKEQEDEEEKESEDGKDSDEETNEQITNEEPEQNVTNEEEPIEESTNESIIAEPIQQISDGWLEISNTKQEIEQQKQQVLTEEQEFKDQLKSILIDINLDEPVTTTSEPVTTTSEMSCNCTPIDGGQEDQQPILNLTGDHKFTQIQTPTTTEELQQIIINPSDIVNSKSIGSITNSDYTGNFSAPNILDNTIDEDSYWSQYGKSGFLIQLKGNALKDWQVCSAEVNAYKANNVPFTLAIQAGQNYTGILDNTVKDVDFGSCVQNVNKIMMYFDSADKYTSIAELKLFGKPINSQQQPSEPPVLEPENPTDSKIIQIKDSNAEISIDNSTVVLKFGSNTYKIDPSSNIVLIPNKGVSN